MRHTVSIALHLILCEKKDGLLPVSGLVVLFLVFQLIILETLGNFLLLCMIWYEKYGMDSKKRTVTNMLLSRIIFVQILCNLFIMPLPTIGLIFDVYSEYFLHRLLKSIQCCAWSSVYQNKVLVNSSWLIGFLKSTLFWSSEDYAKTVLKTNGFYQAI